MATPSRTELQIMIAEMQAAWEHFFGPSGVLRPPGETRASLELDGEDNSMALLDDPRAGYGIGHFGPEHGLTPQQAAVSR